MKRLLVLSMGLILLLALVVIGLAQAAPTATLYVDDDDPTCGGNSPCYASIQAAENAASSGDTIIVRPGTYAEQVVINVPNLTIDGDSSTTTIVQPTSVSANTTSLVTGNPIAAIVLVDGVSGVTIQDIRVDGGPAAFNNCAPGYMGVFYRNASGTLKNSDIRNIFHPSAPGCQAVLAVFVQSGGSGSANVVIANNSVTNYGKNGITANEANTQALITGNTVTGRGPALLGDAAQNGIQIGWGATGTVAGNTVSMHSYVPTAWVAVGILLYLSDASTSDNVVLQNEVGIYHIEGAGTHAYNTVSATAAGTGVSELWGIVVDAPPSSRAPSPFDEGLGDRGRDMPTAVQNATVSGNTITGDSTVTTTVGLESDAGYSNDNINFTATDNTITNWGYGILFTKCTTGCGSGVFTSLEVHANNISGNTVYGLLNDPSNSLQVDAENNWWGHASGPSGAGSGSGDAVSTNVDFTPWLTNPSSPAAVQPGDLDGWQLQGGHLTGGTNTASLSFVTGPATPPLGAGSVQFTVGSDGNSFVMLRNPNFQGVRLDEITSLIYSTYVSQFVGGQAPYLSLLIDQDGDGDVDDRLYFEPVYQTGGYSYVPGDPGGAPNQCPTIYNCVALNTWQTWNALVGGWWSLNDSTFGPPLRTIAGYLALHPNARIVNASDGFGGVRLIAGGGAGAWDNFVGNADALIITTDSTTYDFEPGPTPPLPGACTLSGSKSGNNAVLSWTASLDADYYHVYRGTTPYFTPGAPYFVTSSTSFTDVNALGDPNTNYYYRVGAVNFAGETLCANRVGAFDYALTPGVGSDVALQDIAYPLDAGLANAEAVAASIGTGAQVRQILKWNASTQTFLAWSHEFGFGENFPTEVGDYYFLTLSSSAPTLGGFVGRVPDPGEVDFPLFPGPSAAACYLNLLSLTLDRPDITNADQLSDDIGGVIQALDWDAPTQTFRAWSNQFSFGDNFATTIGYPYAICLGPAAAPNEDAYTSLNNPNGTYGTLDPNYLQIQASRTISPTCDATRIAFLKFPATTLASDTTTATLTLRNAQYSGPTSGITLGLYAVSSDAWNENTLTWNNKPALGGLLSSVSTSQIVGQSQITFPTSSALVNHINAQRVLGDGLVSFAVAWVSCPIGAPQLRVDSSEGALAPQLTTLVPPLPPVPRLGPQR